MSTIKELLHTLQVQFDEISTRNVQLVKNICSLEDRLKCSEDEVTELRKQERVWMKRCDRLGAMLSEDELRRLKTVMSEVLEDVCGAKLCSINSMSSRGEMMRLLERATTNLRKELE